MSTIKSFFKPFVKTTLTPIALCLTLAYIAPAVAHKGQNQQHYGMRQILSELSLTGSQKQDIRQIFKPTREDRELFSGDAKSLKTELRSLVQSTNWDQAAIESAITQRQTLIQKRALQRATNKNQVWNVLSETQQTELVAQVEQHAVKRQGKGKRKGNKQRHFDLTETQLAAVQTIETETKASGEETRANLKTYKQTERALIHSTDFNVEAWQTLNNEYQDDFLAMAVLKAKRKHDIWNLLTPEQQVKAQEKSDKKHKRRNKRVSG